MLKSTCSVAGGQVLNEHATLFMSVLGNLQSPTKLLRLSSNGVLRRARHLNLSSPPSISSCQWCLLFVTGSWYRGLTVLGGGGVRKDSFPPSPSNACHTGYFLSAKRHKGSLWQWLNYSFPDCSLQASSTLEIARVVLARRLAVTKAFYRVVDAWDLFLVFEVWYAVYFSEWAYEVVNTCV